METFTCGALVEMVLPKEKVSDERQAEIGIACDRIDELMHESIRGRKLSAVALKDSVHVSFVCGVFDTSDVKEAWDLVLHNSGKVVVKPVNASNLQMNIYLPYEKVNNDGIIPENLLATNRAVMFRKLLKELSGRGISSLKVDTDRLNEIAEEYAAMEVCTETSYISVEVDETFDTMINMELSGKLIRIINPPAFVQAHHSSWGFDFSPATCGMVQAETTFDGYLNLEDLLENSKKN